MIPFDLGLDLFPLLAATLAAIACGVLGNFLVLRKLSLMGDAISHSVLPGLVIAILITGAVAVGPVMLGAALAGIVTVVLVELIKSLGRVESGAAMGVVFSILFALGVLLLQRASAGAAHIDTECVLYGQLETLVWYDAPASLDALLSFSTLQHLPRQVVTLAAVAAIAIAFTAVFFKELRIAAFDAALATTQGFNATLMHYLLMLLVAAATVASFEAVGSILVIAMLVGPAATARLLTDRLLTQIMWSIAIATTAGVVGYLAATAVPAAFGLASVNAAGTITAVVGLLFTLALFASPSHGFVMRTVRRGRLSRRAAIDDVLAELFRAAERGLDRVPLADLTASLAGRPVRAAVRTAAQRKLIQTSGAELTLTDTGHRAAARVIRRHRLWERYLVDRAGVALDHVHDPAEQLEHIDTEPPEGPDRDPHGRDIPAE